MEKFLLNGQRINGFDFTRLEDYSSLYIKGIIKENIKEILLNKDFYLNCLVRDKRKSVNSLVEFITKEEEKYLTKLKHFNSMMEFDKSFGNIVAGVDEVGRGPLAGPIVGACVILNTDVEMEELMHEINDSKKLTTKKRQELVPLIKKYALSYSITMHTNEDIDNLGLAYCNNNIFLMALKELEVKPDIVLSDGYYVKKCPYRNEKVIKGDAKSAAIACASILAKEFRDDLMREYDSIFPGYGFASNVGYGSRDHISAILELGTTKIHRQSFLTTILADNEDITSNNEE